jgi:putative YhdH/YhfP family quinone oxidoreductase
LKNLKEADMGSRRYKGLLVRQVNENQFTTAVEELVTDRLPAGDVLVKVLFSSLNYKDMLSANGNRGVTKKYPHTPGIDAAGVVEESSVKDFKPGDEVIVTSYDLGMNTSGGLGQYIRVPSSWVVHKPAGMSLRESMIFGTAGFTAALSVLRLVEFGMDPDDEILVTGASGGVGSIAVSILSHTGYNVTALNSLHDESGFLKKIGAKQVLDPSELIDTTGRPMLKERWAKCVDTLGGDVLTSAIRSVRSYGAVTCCGNVISPDLKLTVFPFILRGVTLYGIDSQNCPMPRRQRAWDMIAGQWKFPWMEKLVSEIPLEGVGGVMDEIKAGKHRGRTVVNLWD